jgi:hypothetical protein
LRLRYEDEGGVGAGDVDANTDADYWRGRARTWVILTLDSIFTRRRMLRAEAADRLGVNSRGDVCAEEEKRTRVG